MFTIRTHHCRGFEFEVTKKSVYPYYLMEELGEGDSDDGDMYENWFNKPRLRKKKKKKDTISKPWEMDRGGLTIRGEHYKINEGLLDMEKRAPFKVDYDRVADCI